MTKSGKGRRKRAGASAPAGPAKTRGWMISELERRGVYVRGKPEAASDSWLAAKLTELGVAVSAGPKDSKEQTEDRAAGPDQEWGGTSHLGPLFGGQ